VKKRIRRAGRSPMQKGKGGVYTGGKIWQPGRGGSEGSWTRLSDGPGNISDFLFNGGQVSGGQGGGTLGGILKARMGKGDPLAPFVCGGKRHLKSPLGRRPGGDEEGRGLYGSPYFGLRKNHHRKKVREGYEGVATVLVFLKSQKRGKGHRQTKKKKLRTIDDKQTKWPFHRATLSVAPERST